MTRATVHGREVFGRTPDLAAEVVAQICLSMADRCSISPYLWTRAHSQGLAARTTERVDAEVGLSMAAGNKLNKAQGWR
ncbi:hypothetical protein NL676_005585 [Syzygium grande]|nr:hypothetical protein NL676_005585 [Syzygium grande]